MKKRFIPIFLLPLLMVFSAAAQQLPQYSQYMNNPYVLNPAASSLFTDVDIHAGFRQQWAGFDGAPQTYYLSGTVNIGPKQPATGTQYSIPISHRSLLRNPPVQRTAKHVVGGLAAVDEYGVFKRSSVMGSYAYHHPLGENYWLAAGVSFGWYGLEFGSNDIILENPDDNTYNDFVANGTNTNLFDVNAGVFLYSDRAFIGYSIYQIGQNEIELGNESTAADLSDAKLNLHQFATLGYRLTVTEGFDLTPSAMFKILGPAPLSIDINLMAEFNQRFRLGISYRNEDAVSILAGVSLNEWLRLDYAYDYVTSEINNLSSGSHEVVLGFQFNRKN